MKAHKSAVHELEYEEMVKDAELVRIQDAKALNGFWGWLKVYKVNKLNMPVVAIYIPMPFKEVYEQLISELQIK